jgi:hypothetical protein
VIRFPEDRYNGSLNIIATARARTSFPYIEFSPKPGQARGIQIDINPARVGLRYPAEVGLIGDSRLILQKLLSYLSRKEERPFLEKARERMQEWRALMEERGTRDDKAMKPQVVAWELGKKLDQGARSCRVIPAPSQPGSRARFLRSAVKGSRYRETWRAWRMVCLTRSQLSLLTRYWT